MHPAQTPSKIGLRRTRRILWWIWGVDLCLVAVGSLLPGFFLAPMHLAAAGISDKYLHFGGYLVLAALPAVGAANRSQLAYAVSAAASLGLLLEILQRLVPDRAFELADFLANVLGIVAGLAAGLLARKIGWFAAN